MSTIFAVATPGLTPITAQELHNLGLLHSIQGDFSQAIETDGGGVEFTGNLRAIYLANLSLRTASRVLVRMGDCHATTFSELRKKVGQWAWEDYLAPEQPVALRVTCHKSRLYHSDAVAERICLAIGDRLGQLPPVQKFDENTEIHPPQLLIVRLVQDHCTVSVDSSGALLHRRGYRLATAKAPLRETLAAGIILASGWDAAAPLLDPFCGSGTIPIEAALIAQGKPPGQSRRFAFMDWPNYDPIQWGNLLAKIQHSASNQLPKITASDRDAGAIQNAQANAERAGVAEWIEFLHRAVSAIEPTGKGWVVTNPPYGLRVRGNKDLRDLYAQFGKVLRERCPGWHVAILCNSLQLLRNTGLSLDTSLSLKNGGVGVRLALGIVRE
jgi:putative N6-adenine-specific DNA methylase